MSQPSGRDYVLGTTEWEHDRLIRQAARLGFATEQLLRDAGIKPGHRVLDIGSGLGDVAFIAARFVGQKGEVVGIDQDAAALAKARRRATSLRLRNVSFVDGDIDSLPRGKLFDAIIGRLIVQFLPQPTQTLRRLAEHLRTGGVMAFQESNWEAMLSQVAHLPLRARCCELIYETFRHAGANMQTGRSLLQAFKALKFSEPQMSLAVPVGVDAGTRRWLHDLVCSLQPRFAQFGLADGALGDTSSLADRLDAELTASGSFAVCIALTGVWSRKKSATRKRRS